MEICVLNSSNMKKETTLQQPSLNLRSIFRCMMEDGYCPSYENDFIQFRSEENIAVVEYKNGILSVRMLFSIEEDGYEMFLEASNQTMLDTQLVKPVILTGMNTIMFSCEVFCNNVREFRRMFPRSIKHLNEALKKHKIEMLKLMNVTEALSATIPTTNNSATGTVKKTSKLLS